MIERGQIFDEMAYLLGEKRIYSAWAVGDGELLLITPGMFEDLLEQSPAVAQKSIISMGRRLKQVAAPAEG